MNRKLRSLLIPNWLICSFLLAWPTISQAQENTKHPKVALVLSGGGAKGFAHIGVLKVLEEEGIPVDLIVGTSMGCLVGGSYAIGYNASELESLVKGLNWETVLSDDVPRAFLSANDKLLKQRYIFALPITGEKKLTLPQGLIKGQNVLNVFCGLAGNVPVDADFQKFPIPFACVATDLALGKEVVIDHGFLPTAMFSSMAIPIAFQSYDRDGRLLVDGGLVNNFPTDVAKLMGADIIIGVDIRDDFYDRKNLNSITNVMVQLVNFFDQEKDSVNKSLCDILIRPDVSEFSMTSFTNEAVDSLILRGMQAANSSRSQLQLIKAKYKLELHEKSREFVSPELWNITDLKLTGNYHLEEAFVRKTLDLEIPGNYSADEIKTAIDKLYGLGGFDRIYYNFEDAGNNKVLNLNISTKRVFTQNVGFKANTTDAAAILINTTQKNYSNVFGLLSAGAELSINPGISLLAETHKTNLPTVGVSMKGKYQNYNVFDSGDKIYKANVFYTCGSIYLYKPFLSRFQLGLGVQEEYFRGDIFSRNDDFPLTTNRMDYFFTNAYSYLSFDSMDDFYFPKKGTNLYAEFSMLADFRGSDQISPMLLFKMRNAIPLTQKTTLMLDVYNRSLFNSTFPVTKMTLVGGEPYSQYFNYHLPFVGLSAVNIADRFVYIGLIGLRYQVSKGQYLSALLNSMIQSSDMVGLKEANTIYGGGFKYSIKTMLGPLDITLGYSGSTDKPTFSANFGYWF